MSKNELEIYSNQSSGHENTIFSKTDYSNSRLSGNFFTTPQPELSFDAMTIVGNNNKKISYLNS